MLNTQHLITFKALVETGSFTLTAQRLRLTQPAVSQHIQKLEHTLGEALFIRHGRRAEVTEAGKLALQYVQDVETCYSKFRSAWQQKGFQSEATEANKTAKQGV